MSKEDYEMNYSELLNDNLINDDDLNLVDDGDLQISHPVKKARNIKKK